MMSMEAVEHKHVKPTFWSDGQIVCADCQLDESQGKNECFCQCHEAEKVICRKCKVYHG